MQDTETLLERDELAELFGHMDSAAAAAITLYDALAEPEGLEKYLYWEARKAGLPFPVQYNPAIGDTLRRLYALGILNFRALSAIFSGVGPNDSKELAKRFAIVLNMAGTAEEEARRQARTAQATEGAMNRHARRAAASERRRRAGRRSK